MFRPYLTTEENFRPFLAELMAANSSNCFLEEDKCKNKLVSYIKYHSPKPYLVAMTMIENLSFDDRAAELTGNSFDSHVLKMNFSIINCQKCRRSFAIYQAGLFFDPHMKSSGKI